MSDYGGDSVSEEEPFDLTIRGLQGRWMHNLGFVVHVKEEFVEFPGGFRCRIIQKKDTVFLEEPRPEHPEGKVLWRANPKKSDASEVHWRNLDDESKCKWELKEFSSKFWRFEPILNKILNSNFKFTKFKNYIYSAKQRDVASPSRCNFSKFQISY